MPLLISIFVSIALWLLEGWIYFLNDTYDDDDGEDEDEDFDFYCWQRRRRVKWWRKWWRRR